MPVPQIDISLLSEKRTNKGTQELSRNNQECENLRNKITNINSKPISSKIEYYNLQI